MFHIVQYMPDMTTLFLSKVLNTKTCIQNNSAKKSITCNNTDKTPKHACTRV